MYVTQILRSHEVEYQYVELTKESFDHSIALWLLLCDQLNNQTKFQPNQINIQKVFWNKALKFS
jgi:hypothetical protein